MQVFIETLGCSKNLVDSQMMTKMFINNRYNIIQNPKEADVIVVNTCGFIDDAKEESVNTILELVNFKENGRCKYFIVTGCLSERYSDELYEEIPEVDAFLGTTTFTEIIHVVDELEHDSERIKKVGNIDDRISEKFESTVDLSKAYAYVKVSEGCDNKCTYCIIPKLRGKYRSRTIEDIYKSVEDIVAKGIKEIILIAQDTARYGIDLYGEYRLAELLNQLNTIEGLKWIRIQYAYPDVIDDEIIRAIKENEKVVPYLDIPIQHINDDVLKRMNRNVTKKEIMTLIEKLRSEIPEMTIRTTLMVGFPGETEAQFEELYNFVEEYKFDKLGVFSYSDQENTPAYNLSEKIAEEIKEERKTKMMMLQKDISEAISYQAVGKTYEVVIEEKLKGENIYLGRSKYDSPEIDGLVYVHTDHKLKIGSFQEVKITDALEYDLIGEL